jgi:adenylate cyclase
MSVWSTSGDSAAVRARAATAAMEIRDAVALFNQRHPDHQLPTRIGLHAGTVLIGAIGGAGHYTATVVGDVANTASRVEALNKHLNTRLLASREALEGVEGLILRPLGGFVLVGKSQTVHVVEILGLASQGANATTLSEGFAKAMAAFRARSWQEATDRFNRLLQDFPEDGPTAFFLKRSLMNSQMAQAPTDEVFVRMDEK